MVGPSRRRGRGVDDRHERSGSGQAVDRSGSGQAVDRWGSGQEADRWGSWSLRTGMTQDRSLVSELEHLRALAIHSFIHYSRFFLGKLDKQKIMYFNTARYVFVQIQQLSEHMIYQFFFFKVMHRSHLKGFRN